MFDPEFDFFFAGFLALDDLAFFLAGRGAAAGTGSNDLDQSRDPSWVEQFLLTFFFL